MQSLARTHVTVYEKGSIQFGLHPKGVTVEQEAFLERKRATGSVEAAVASFFTVPEPERLF